MSVLRWAVYLFLALVVAVVVAGQLGWLSGARPTDLGVRQGRLKAPSNTPNSVSSQADLGPDHPQRQYAAIDPFPLKNGDAAMSMQALVRVLSQQPGIQLVEQRPEYVHATAQTLWLKFVDDLEFWVNPERQVIELRSASRIGRKDFGVNRQRMEALRVAYLASP